MAPGSRHDSFEVSIAGSLYSPHTTSVTSTRGNRASTSDSGFSGFSVNCPAIVFGPDVMTIGFAVSGVTPVIFVVSDVAPVIFVVSGVTPPTFIGSDVISPTFVSPNITSPTFVSPNITSPTFTKSTLFNTACFLCTYSSHPSIKTTKRRVTPSALRSLSSAGREGRTRCTSS